MVPAGTLVSEKTSKVKPANKSRRKAVRRSVAMLELDLLVHGVQKICFSHLPEFSADLRAFIKCLAPSKWVSYDTLVGVTNGDVRSTEETLTVVRVQWAFRWSGCLSFWRGFRI